MSHQPDQTAVSGHSEVAPSLGLPVAVQTPFNFKSLQKRRSSLILAETRLTHGSPFSASFSATSTPSPLMPTPRYPSAAVSIPAEHSWKQLRKRHNSAGAKGIQGDSDTPRLSLVPFPSTTPTLCPGLCRPSTEPGVDTEESDQMVSKMARLQSPKKNVWNDKCCKDACCSSLVPFASVSTTPTPSQTGLCRPSTEPGVHVEEHDELVLKLARLQSPSKPKPLHTQKAQRELLTLGSGKPYMPNKRCFMSAADASAKRAEQRGSQGWYKSNLFFGVSNEIKNARVTDEHRLATTSCRMAPKFMCRGITNCTHGDCLHSLESLDIFKQRTLYCAKSAGSSLKEVLLAELFPFYDRATQRWQLVPVHLDELTTIYCCPCSFCLLVGVSPSVGYSIIHDIVAGLQFEPTVPRFVSYKDNRHQNTLDWSLLRQYVATLLNKHEADPAPGAHQPGRQTFITKQSWKQKWDACRTYFQDADRQPGSQSMLKRVWKLEKRLKERRAKSHSKCSTCSGIATKEERLKGVNTEQAKRERIFIRHLHDEHETMHLGAREELDSAGLQSMVNARHIWTICIDAATQRNFELPKLTARTPKELAGKPFWGFKLMATYVYGDGFYPFLVHDSQKMGANLTWTVIWLTLTELRRKRGYWPDVIHLQLDNTKGENKNEVMIMLSAWLAAVKVMQVRVYFLPVGHTHIVIDHIFGIITVGLRRAELLTPIALMQNIDHSLAACPVYNAKPTRWIHALWDFSTWADVQMQHYTLERLFGGDVQDEHGTYSGMYDFVFNRDKDFYALLQYREHCTHPFLPATGACKTIKFLPTSIPSLQEIKPTKKWKMLGSFSVTTTFLLCSKYARTLLTPEAEKEMIREWNRIVEDVPSTIMLLKPELKITFEFFSSLEVPRLAGPQLGDIGTEETFVAQPFARAYQEWKQRFIGYRTGPMAIDPVISSEQSVAEFQKLQRAWQSTVGFEGPSAKSTTPVFLGKFVLARTGSGSGVTLFCIRKCLTPTAGDLSCTSVEYEHSPNVKASGLFGTFCMLMVPNADPGSVRKQQCRRVLTRSQIVVYNAELIRACGNSKVRVLSLSTLRCLALALPDEYPMPSQCDIPETHLVAGTSAGRRKGGRTQRNSESADDCSESSAGSTTSESESGEESDDESSGSSPAEDSDSSSNDNDAERGPVYPQNAPIAANSEMEADETTSPAIDNGPLLSMATTLVGETLVEAGTLIFINMLGSKSKEFKSMKIPISLAFVRSVLGSKLVVHWFQLSKPDFDLKCKTQVYKKFWSDPNWPKKEKLSKKSIPTTQQIFKYWVQQEVKTKTVVNICIPKTLYTLEKVIQKDEFRLPTQFVEDVIIPYLDDTSDT